MLIYAASQLTQFATFKFLNTHILSLQLIPLPQAQFHESTTKERWYGDVLRKKRIIMMMKGACKLQTEGRKCLLFSYEHFNILNVSCMCKDAVHMAPCANFTLGTIRVTEDSAAIAAAPVRRESGFARCSSMYCSYYYDMNSQVFNP